MTKSHVIRARTSLMNKEKSKKKTAVTRPMSRTHNLEIGCVAVIVRR